MLPTSGDLQVGVERHQVVRQVSHGFLSSPVPTMKVMVSSSGLPKEAPVSPGSSSVWSPLPPQSPGSLQVPPGKASHIITQGIAEGTIRSPKKLACHVVPPGVNTTTSVGNPKARPYPDALTEKHVMNLLKMQEDSLRELVHDVEARLTAQIQDVKSMTVQGLLELKTSSIEAFQAESGVTKSTAEEQLKDMEAIAPFVQDLEARLTAQIQDVLLELKTSSIDTFQAKSGVTKSTTEEQIKDTYAVAPEVEIPEQCVNNVPESVRITDENSSGDGTLLLDNFMLQVAGHVIERVHADPRICELVDSHQAIKESFVNLLYIMEQQRRPTDKNSEVHDVMNDVQKLCKSISLEVRQLRQRCNQDVSQTTLRFEALEKRHQIIEDALIPDKDRGITEAFESNVLQKWENDGVLQLVEESYEEQSPRPSDFSGSGETEINASADFSGSGVTDMNASGITDIDASADRQPVLARDHSEYISELCARAEDALVSAAASGRLDDLLHARQTMQLREAKVMNILGQLGTAALDGNLKEALRATFMDEQEDVPAEQEARAPNNSNIEAASARSTTSSIVSDAHPGALDVLLGALLENPGWQAKDTDR